MAAWRCLSCWTFFLAFILRCWSEVGLMCEVANIQVESEDGRTQTFEMKKMEPRRGDYCLSCSRPSLSSAPHVTTLRSKLILSIADKEISSECDPSRSELPLGLCSFNTESSSCYKESPTVDTCTLHSEELAEEIVQKKMVPYATGETDIDKRIALGIVLFNRGDIEGSIQQFTSIIRDRPNAVPAYYGRGIAYSRKRLQGPLIARKAVADFKEVIDRDIKNEIKQRYERRAEAHISLGQYHKALEDLDKAVVLNPEGKASFARGIVHIIIGNFADAEKDFKDILDSAEGPNHLSSLFYLGLAQYYRGKVRNAIEVFKDVLKKDPENLEASTSLSQAFREIGNLRAARIRFNQSLAMNPYHAPTLLLRGSLMYYSGNPQEAFQDFQTCIDGNERNVECEYMKALSSVSMGNFYEGVKTATKIMVQVRSSAIMTASPEFLKAHYLREYARYLHSNLEKPLEELKLDIDLSEEFRDHWAKMLPFEFKNPYREQSGLQPHILDISKLTLTDYSRPVYNLICKAHKVGLLMQVNTDGYTANRRLNLAMGLSAIHIAQLYESRWKGLRQNKPFDKTLNWKDMFEIAVQYRRMVDPEQPVLWLDLMPDHNTNDGYKTEINFMRGPVQNIKTIPYFDLVFKMVKTMLQHYSSSDDKVHQHVQDDIDKAKTCQELLAVTKKQHSNGFVVSTQVHSTRKRSEKDRLDGAMLVLTEDLNNHIIFSIEVSSKQSRTNSYHQEIDYIYNQLQDEIRRTGNTKTAEMDSVVNIILSLVYYFYNLMPLTRGSSVVAYSVALGLIMSVGRQVTGRIPAGKLLEMEAMLSGAPDAFIMVTKQWMNIKRMNTPMVTLPYVWEAFPTVRSVLEVLNVNTDSC
ncbi:hypothetical protein ACJMK2_037196 [Sinanodonta woodiana]|uniref:Tetratricopeptide repeat protein 13 n=1 Tax=Sinanodonta woodiana TaxID=1069815 RepID=A0ABD3WJL0_SINWO